MYAGLVLGQLVCWNLVRLHILRVCVTMAASFGHSRRMHRRAGILHGSYIMISVATDAGRRLLISLIQSLAMYAGSVRGFLIHTKSWIDSLHERSIAVTPAAKGGHCGGLRLSNIARGGVHCPLFVRLAGIPSMAVRTRDPSAAMH